MADTSSATTSPTWNSLIFTCPSMPKIGMSGRSLALSISLASRATFGVMSVDGAPVSKIRLYGPWPFSFTLTMKWPDGNEVELDGLRLGVGLQDRFVLRPRE